MRRSNGIVEFVSLTLRRATDKEGRRTVKRRCLTLPLALLLTVPAWPQQKPLDLTEQSIEDLMNIEVTSVMKGVQKMSQVGQQSSLSARQIFAALGPQISRTCCGWCPGWT
jgi:hypothetical protein